MIRVGYGCRSRVALTAIRPAAFFASSSRQHRLPTRSLSCARAHAEPIAYERHELMPDVHRAKGDAQPPHSGLSHPRKNRPRAKHYIDLVEHMKCDTADAVGLSARRNVHPAFQEAVRQLRQHGGSADDQTEQRQLYRTVLAP